MMILIALQLVRQPVPLFNRFVHCKPIISNLQHNIQNMLNLQTCNAFVLAVYVVVKYFLFLICMCVSAVVATIVVQHLYLCSESKPLVPMHTWVCKAFLYTVVFPLSLKVLSNGVLA